MTIAPTETLAGPPLCAATGSETPLKTERRVETGKSSGLVGVGGVRRVNPKSIEAAKANAKRFWTDPELIAKNLAGRKSKRFKDTHTTEHLQTEAMREKCTKAKRKSKSFQASRKQAGKFLQSAEVRARARQAWNESPLAAEAVKTMREAMAQSEKCQMGIKHHAGRKWHLRSPSNVEYHFLNLAEFIRRNPQLFDPSDVPVKAMRGIGMLRPSDTRKRISGTWKGWTWISLCEVFNNAGDDLLHREADSLGGGGAEPVAKTVCDNPKSQNNALSDSHEI